MDVYLLFATWIMNKSVKIGNWNLTADDETLISFFTPVFCSVRLTKLLIYADLAVFSINRNTISCYYFVRVVLFPRFISKFEPSGLLADRGHISVETCTHRIGGCEATTIWGCYAMLSCRVHWLRSSDEPLRLGAGPSEQGREGQLNAYHKTSAYILSFENDGVTDILTTYLSMCFSFFELSS